MIRGREEKRKEAKRREKYKEREWKDRGKENVLGCTKKRNEEIEYILHFYQINKNVNVFSHIKL